MIRAGLDSNVLVYANLEPDTAKGARALHIVDRAGGGVIPLQALLEYVAVVRRKKPALVSRAVRQIEFWSRDFEIAPTTDAVASVALEIVRDHGLQVWDAVIWAATEAAGASILLTEDMQHGFSLRGVRALNPFLLTSAEIDELLD